MLLAIAYERGRIELWDVCTLALRGRLLDHSRFIGECVFSPDGRTLVSDSMGETARLWDVATGEELLTMGVPVGDQLSQPRFSPDGRTLGFCAHYPGGHWLFLVPTALPEGLTAEEGP
jgi:WD40 repeat protein